MIPFPETIELVSDGHFYPSSSILSSGRLNILPITAKHEELLSNSNKARLGLLEREFVSSLVVEPINYDELLHCDRDSILLNIRLANYGPRANVKIECNACSETFEHEMSFLFRSNPFHFDGKSELSYVFPKCKREVKFKLGTCEQYEVYKSRGWIAFAKLIVTSVGGIDDVGRFFDNELGAIDSRAFREHYFARTPGYDTTTVMTCPKCGHQNRHTLPITTELFGVTPASKLTLHEELFDLCYYSNGAFHPEVVYGMPVSLRTFFVKRLVDAKKAESDAHKSAMSGKSTSKGMAKPPTFNK